MINLQVVNNLHKPIAPHIELVSDVQLVDGTDITILMRCFLKQTNVEVAFGEENINIFYQLRVEWQFYIKEADILMFLKIIKKKF